MSQLENKTQFFEGNIYNRLLIQVIYDHLVPQYTVENEIPKIFQSIFIRVILSVNKKKLFYVWDLWDVITYSHLAWADFKIKVKQIAHSTVHFDQWNPLISKM